jgi:hypothetical protein
MTGRLSRATVTTQLVVVLTVMGAAAGAGASPDPSASPVPVPSSSRVPVDCGSTAASLPPTIDGVGVIASTTAGVATIDPDELLDPMLIDLGRTRADVCVVVFRYGEADDALTGQLVRIVDTHASDLAGRFVAMIREAVVGQGGTASPSVLDLDGQTVWSLDVLAGGQDTRVLAWQMGDTLLVTSGLDAMGRLVSAARGQLASPSAMPPAIPPG